MQSSAEHRHEHCHERHQTEASHRVAPLTPAHLPHGSCPAGSSTYGPRDKVRTTPPPAHCGTPLTRVVPHREHNPQLQRQGSHNVPPRPFRHAPHANRAPKELHLWHQRATSHGVPVPMSAHASTGSFTCGLSGRVRAGASGLFGSTGGMMGWAMHVVVGMA